MKTKMLTPWIGILSLLVLFGSTAHSQTFTDPAEAGQDFALQGEYAGTVDAGGRQMKFGVQVIALGDGKFRAVASADGLPGDGWFGGEREEIDGTLDGGQVRFEGGHANATLVDGILKLTDKDNQPMGELKRVLRQSATLGAAPPEGAVVLFDGSSTEHFVLPRTGEAARMTSDGLLMQGANSKQRFGSGQLHIEFQLPFQPAARGQARGNSGCYLQGRYEVQMLDSFGLSGEHNECGGIYGIRKPDVNMCYPPLSWQTFDIDYTAPQFDDSGEKTANARITVRHNGVVIHDDIEIPKTTTAAPVAESTDDGFLHLQDHGNPVRYRNIWFLEK